MFVKFKQEKQLFVIDKAFNNMSLTYMKSMQK